MGLSINNLENCFKAAKEKHYKFVGVGLTLPNAEGIEIIINSEENFDYKLEYYKNTYNEDLTHKHVEGLKIVNFTLADNFSQIEQDLAENV